MKKVVIIASSRSKESRVFEIVNALTSKRNKVEYVVIDPISFRIHPSHDASKVSELSNKLMDKRISDDTKVIKDHMLTTDLIIVISPVCGGNIHSDLKSVLSKISAWLRLFKLAQKPVILATTSEVEDSQHVLDNLESTFNAFGASVLLKSDFISNQSSEDYSDKIDVINALINQILAVEVLSFKPNKTQEDLYITYKKMISMYPKDNDEYLYWKNSGLLSCSSLTEYYDTLVCECYF